MGVAKRFQSLLDLVYAPSCSACDAPLPAPVGLCATCLESCEPIGVACPTCSDPIAGPLTIRCARCCLRRPALDSCTAAYKYGGQLAIALRRLKFEGRSDVAKGLTPLLLESFQSAAARVDIALALPLHRRRLAARGFNQSQRLLLPLARRCRLPVLRGALRRPQATRPQAQLPAKDRKANVQGAFAANQKVRGKRVLLLDDIRTTGATLAAAAWALRRAGASEVHAFVAARADFSEPS